VRCGLWWSECDDAWRDVPSAALEGLKGTGKEPGAIETIAGALAGVCL